MEKIKCEHCSKEYSKKGIGTHIWKMHGDGKNHDPNRGYKDGSRKAWNKGLDKTDKRVKKYGDSLKGKETWMKGKKHSDESKKKMSESALKSFELGTHASWKTRDIESYPEKYFKWLLNEFELSNYIFNHPIKKEGRVNYFLDFYFDNKKIDLEIDGSQHELSERKESDKNRDIYLNSIGIKVYRIKWKNDKNYLNEKIKEFIDFYNAVLV